MSHVRDLTEDTGESPDNREIDLRARVSEEFVHVSADGAHLTRDQVFEFAAQLLKGHEQRFVMEHPEFVLDDDGDDWTD